MRFWHRLDSENKKSRSSYHDWQEFEIGLTPALSRCHPLTVLGRLYKSVIVLALAGSIGLHWALLQSVAWVDMVASYSQDSTLSNALSKTFDGKHPCKLCQAVRAGRRSEKRQDAQNVETQSKFFLGLTPAVLYPPLVFSLRLPPSVSALSRTETPPTPPPRDCII